MKAHKFIKKALIMLLIAAAATFQLSADAIRGIGTGSTEEEARSNAILDLSRVLSALGGSGSFSELTSREALGGLDEPMIVRPDRKTYKAVYTIMPDAAPNYISKAMDLHDSISKLEKSERWAMNDVLSLAENWKSYHALTSEYEFYSTVARVLDPTADIPRPKFSLGTVEKAYSLFLDNALKTATKIHTEAESRKKKGSELSALDSIILAGYETSIIPILAEDKVELDKAISFSREARFSSLSEKEQMDLRRMIAGTQNCKSSGKSSNDYETLREIHEMKNEWSADYSKAVKAINDTTNRYNNDVDKIKSQPGDADTNTIEAWYRRESYNTELQKVHAKAEAGLTKSRESINKALEYIHTHLWTAYSNDGKAGISITGYDWYKAEFAGAVHVHDGYVSICLPISIGWTELTGKEVPENESYLYAEYEEEVRSWLNILTLVPDYFETEVDYQLEGSLENDIYNISVYEVRLQPRIPGPASITISSIPEINSFFVMYGADSIDISKGLPMPTVDMTKPKAFERKAQSEQAAAQAKANALKMEKEQKESAAKQAQEKAAQERARKKAERDRNFVRKSNLIVNNAFMCGFDIGFAYDGSYGCSMLGMNPYLGFIIKNGPKSNLSGSVYFGGIIQMDLMPDEEEKKIEPFAEGDESEPPSIQRNFIYLGGNLEQVISDMFFVSYGVKLGGCSGYDILSKSEISGVGFDMSVSLNVALEALCAYKVGVGLTVLPTSTDEVSVLPSFTMGCAFNFSSLMSR